MKGLTDGLPIKDQIVRTGKHPENTREPHSLALLVRYRYHPVLTMQGLVYSVLLLLNAPGRVVYVLLRLILGNLMVLISFLIYIYLMIKKHKLGDEGRK
jgi:hypothetical protein